VSFETDSQAEETAHLDQLLPAMLNEVFG